VKKPAKKYSLSQRAQAFFFLATAVEQIEPLDPTLADNLRDILSPLGGDRWKGLWARLQLGERDDLFNLGCSERGGPGQKVLR